MVMFGFNENTMEIFNEMWKQGNSLFDKYVLVCNKLDESLAGMAHLTTGKQGIITFNEENKTSHAMTVARDLGIPAMGQQGHIDDPDHFIHRLQTGDTVRMKSNGKKAVAYIEKKRETDPYDKFRY